MSHNIEIIDGRACHAWHGEKPWHGLGFEVDADMTPGQMMVAAGADWGVTLRPTYAEHTMRNGKVKRVDTGYKALLRDTDGKALTVTGHGWHPIQNEEAFNFFNDFVKNGQLEMHTAGVLRGGQVVWALAKVKKSFALFRGKDRVETHMLFHSPHIYGKSAGVMVTPTRVVCDNTLAIAIGGEKSFHARISHRKPFAPEEVQRQIEAATRAVDEYKEKAELLASRRVNLEMLRAYTDAVFPGKSGKGKSSRLADLAYAVIETQPGAEFGKGTWWSAFNAVTFTTDHLAGQQYSTEKGSSAMDDRRLYQAWFGAVQRRKIWALDAAVAAAKKSRAA